MSYNIFPNFLSSTRKTIKGKVLISDKTQLFIKVDNGAIDFKPNTTIQVGDEVTLEGQPLREHAALLAKYHEEHPDEK